jgi:hypothetical protein
VRIHDTAVNPHKYMRETMQEFASSKPASNGTNAGMM